MRPRILRINLSLGEQKSWNIYLGLSFTKWCARLKCRYGDSEGFPSQKGLTLDAQVTWSLAWTLVKCNGYSFMSAKFNNMRLQITKLSGSAGLLDAQTWFGPNKDCGLWKVTWWSCWICSCQEQPWKGTEITLYNLCHV